ncbi:diguanylate cyclase, partial [bacterium]|nr:diguanylate cyclase [bacterium]
MARKTTPNRSALFLGFPEEFRRAHSAELHSIAASPLWATSLEDTGSRSRPNVVVVNMDAFHSQESALATALKARFPHAIWIAVSSKDSAVLAMRCLRDGFKDFLTQPVTSEELALAILRASQTTEKDVAAPLAFERALASISSASSPASLRLRTLFALKDTFGAKQALWTQGPRRKERVLAQTPRARLGKKARRCTFACAQSAQERITLNGIAPLKAPQRMQAQSLVRHAELTLLNLKRVEKLKHLTLVDDLTGLYNSRYFRFALESAAADYRSKRQSFALLFLDLDHFKRVNDRHGHLVGSEFLAALGKILRNAVRGADSVFRYGGDEFVILLRHTETKRAKEIGERLRTMVERRQFLIRGTPL